MKDKLKVRAMHPMVAAGLAWASLRSVIYRKVPVGVEPSWALEAKGTVQMSTTLPLTKLPGGFLSCSACKSLSVTLGSEEADGHTLGGPSGPVPLVVVWLGNLRTRKGPGHQWSQTASSHRCL